MLLEQSHRTRPPPADTRRACCHVLSSFQRTGLARPPATGLSTVVRRTFQTYQPANPVSTFYFGCPGNFRAHPPHSFVLRRGIHTHEAFRPASTWADVASPAMPKLRGTEPGDFSNLKVGMRAVCFRRGLPFGCPCAPVTLRRAKRIYGPAPAVSTGNPEKLCDSPNLLKRRELYRNSLPRWLARRSKAEPVRKTGATKPSSSP
jgi:hypothetical protein